MRSMPLAVSLLCPWHCDLFFIFPDRREVPKELHQILLWPPWITLSQTTLGAQLSISVGGEKEAGKGESHSAQGLQLA